MGESAVETFKFARQNPEYYAAWRTCGSWVVVSTVVLTVLLVGQILPMTEFLWWELFFLVFGIAFLAVWTLPRKLGAGIHISPELLLVDKWPSSNRVFIPWQDIRSIRLETWSERDLLSRVYAAVAFGKNASDPYVAVETSRMVSMPFWSGRTTTRRLGIPRGKVFRFYLDDPERFLQRAGQFLPQTE